ncbi:unnamed protein product, partial [Prorocentrum cordatum]
RQPQSQPSSKPPDAEPTDTDALLAMLDKSLSEEARAELALFKDKIAPPKPAQQESLDAKYQRLLAAERKAAAALTKAATSESKAKEWVVQCEAHTQHCAEALGDAQAAVQETLDAINEARGTRAPSAFKSTAGGLNLSKLLLSGEDLAFEEGEAFDTSDLELDAEDAKKWADLKQQFLDELKTKVKEVFGSGATAIQQRKQELEALRSRLRAKRPRTEADGSGAQAAEAGAGSAASEPKIRRTFSQPSFRTIYVRNITDWGPKCKKIVKSPPFQADILGLLETHQSERTSDAVLAEFDASAWKAVISPSRADGTAQKAGGVVLGARRHLQCSSLDHLARYRYQTKGQLRHRKPEPHFVAGPIDFWDFQALTIQMQHGQLTVLIVYLTTSIGVAGQNLIKLQNLGAVIKSLTGDWIAIGDWNVVPTELEESGWVNYVDGRICKPSNVSFTQFTGGRMLDYAVIGGPGHHVPAKLFADTMGDHKSHMGLVAQYTSQSAPAWALILPTPFSFAHPPAEQKAADPNSKRSRAKREAEQRRLERMQDNPLEALNPEVTEAASQQQPVDGPPLPAHMCEPPPRGGRAVPADLPSRAPGGPAIWRSAEAGAAPSAAEAQDMDHGELQSHDRLLGFPMTPPCPTVARRTAAEKDELWAQVCHRQVQYDAPPDYIRDSQAYQSSSEAADDLGKQYAKWITHVEYFYTDIMNAMARTNDALSEAGENAADIIYTHAHAMPDDNLVPIDNATKLKWQHGLSAVREWSTDQAATMAYALGILADRFQRAEVRQGLQAFQEWVIQCTAKRPSKVLKWNTDSAGPIMEYGVGPTASTDLFSIMEGKRGAWSQRWSGTVNLSDLQAFRRKCRLLEELEDAWQPIDPYLIHDKATALPNATGRGSDNLGPLDIRNLPFQAKQGLADFFNQCERQMAWPWQLMSVLVGMLPKPDGSDRGVALIPWLMRFWAQMRKVIGADWCAAKAGHWDQAIKGSSALQCGIFRLFCDEVDDELDIHYANVMWDFAEFYDSVNPIMAFEAALRLDFSPRKLGMAAVLYMSP